MSMPDGSECNCQKLLADKEIWKIILEPAFCQDPNGVHTLAQRLFTLKEAIESGPEGSLRAINTLLDGIERIYLYTAAHKAASKLYLLSLEGNLKPWDEPLQLINAAIERGLAETRSVNRRQEKSPKRRREHCKHDSLYSRK